MALPQVGGSHADSVVTLGGGDFGGCRSTDFGRVLRRPEARILRQTGAEESFDDSGGLSRSATSEGLSAPTVGPEKCRPVASCFDPVFLCGVNLWHCHKFGRRSGLPPRQPPGPSPSRAWWSNSGRRRKASMTTITAGSMASRNGMPRGLPRDGWSERHGCLQGPVIVKRVGWRILNALCPVSAIGRMSHGTGVTEWEPTWPWTSSSQSPRQAASSRRLLAFIAIMGISVLIVFQVRALRSRGTGERRCPEPLIADLICPGARHIGIEQTF